VAPSAADSVPVRSNVVQVVPLPSAVVHENTA